MLKTNYEEMYHALTNFFAPSQLLTGDAISRDYGHDEMESVFHLPDVLVFPTSTDEIAQVMRLANQYDVPVIARGAGTGLVGGCVAIEGGILLDLSKMNHILELDEENAVLVTEAGVMLKDIADYAQQHGYLYAPDPGEKTATIGGNISTNAGGMRAVKYGVTRNSVQALTVVTAKGDIVELGGKVVKNSSGFDLKDLFIGSEGTLGIVTTATLKLLPLPKFSTSLLVPFSNFSDAIANVPRILNSGITPTALEFFEADSIKYWEQFTNKSFPENGFAAYLLLTLDGQQQESVESAYETLAELCLDNNAADAFVLDNAELKKQVWSARDSFLEAIKNSTPKMDEVDAVVPRSAIAEFISFTHQYAKDNQIRIPGFGHAGDGNLHLYICKDNYSETDWQEKLAATFDALYQKATELKGKISGEHGIGFAKKHYLATSSSVAELELMRTVKSAIDPNNILNPQKVI